MFYTSRATLERDRLVFFWEPLELEESVGGMQHTYGVHDEAYKDGRLIPTKRLHPKQRLKTHISFAGDLQRYRGFQRYRGLF